MSISCRSQLFRKNEVIFISLTTNKSNRYFYIFILTIADNTLSLNHLSECLLKYSEYKDQIFFMLLFVDEFTSVEFIENAIYGNKNVLIECSNEYILKNWHRYLNWDKFLKIFNLFLYKSTKETLIDKRIEENRHLEREYLFKSCDNYNKYKFQKAIV